jgi:hypothetical protein
LPAILSTVSFPDFPIPLRPFVDIEPSGKANRAATSRRNGVDGVTVPGGGISKRFATPASVADVGTGMSAESALTAAAMAEIEGTMARIEGDMASFPDRSI